MIVAGNWKMNMNRRDAGALTAGIADWCSKCENPATVIIFPPAILMDTVSASLRGGVMMGGQDCHSKLSGAHTGDIAADMLREAGCSWVLAGHSERRLDHGETSTLVQEKAKAASASKLTPIICVGETLAERKDGRAFDCVEKQIRTSLPHGIDASSFVIAYEPVWAIGTGQVASPEDVDKMHNFIRKLLQSINADYKDVPILYGGSVKPYNVADLMTLDNVGGALVGGASLKCDEFIAIAEAASSAS